MITINSYIDHLFCDKYPIRHTKHRGGSPTKWSKWQISESTGFSARERRILLRLLCLIAVILIIQMIFVIMYILYAMWWNKFLWRYILNYQHGCILASAWAWLNIEPQNDNHFYQPPITPLYPIWISFDESTHLVHVHEAVVVLVQLGLIVR